MFGASKMELADYKAKCLKRFIYASLFKDPAPSENHITRTTDNVDEFLNNITSIESK